MRRRSYRHAIIAIARYASNRGRTCGIEDAGGQFDVSDGSSILYVTEQALDAVAAGIDTADGMVLPVECSGKKTRITVADGDVVVCFIDSRHFVQLQQDAPPAFQSYGVRDLHGFDSGFPDGHYGQLDILKLYRSQRVRYR